MRSTYYKLAMWCPRTLTFKDGKRAHPDEQAAVLSVKVSGKYRISRVHPDGTRVDGVPFDIDVTLKQPPKPRKVYPAHATRPMGGRPH
jgi:hypothetical protein